MSKKEFIEDLFRRRAIYNDDDQAETTADLMNKVSKDIYSEGHRFVFELIQNADDSALEQENEVYFDFFGDTLLVVSHNGEPFSERDISSITKSGDSTKTDDPKKTGYKGIGFKSVFSKSNHVVVISDGYFFRFEKKYHTKILPWQIIPIWTEEDQISNNVHTHVLKKKYNVSTIIHFNKPEAFQKDVFELLADGQVLLFLRNVKKIAVSQDGNLIQSVEKRVSFESKAFNRISIVNNGVDFSSWIVKNYDEVPIPEFVKTALQSEEEDAPKKLKKAEYTDLSFAVKIERDKMLALSGDESMIFTYLPTKATQFNFPFLINGSFITTSSREAVHSDRQWNKWLFELVAQYMFDWISLLSATEYKYQVLKILALKFNAPGNRLKQSFDDSFSKHLSGISFIPTKGGNTRKVHEVLVDKTDLSDQSFVHAQAILSFINNAKGKSFSDDPYVSPMLENQSALKSLGVEFFDLENVTEFFTSAFFVGSHRVEQNLALIRYIKVKSDSDEQGIWFQKARRLPFIFDDDGELNNPSTGICFPVGIGATELGKIPVIHPTVYKEVEHDSVMTEWLKKLGVKEASTESYVTNVIIPNIRKSDYITNSNFLEIAKFLLNLFKKNSLDEKMLEGLREMNLKTTEPEKFEQAQFCYLSNRYQPQLQIEGVIENVSYVSEEYLKIQNDAIEWNRFFRAIKVKDKIEVEIINENNELPALRLLTSPDWVLQGQAKAKLEPGSFGFEDENIIREIKIPSFLKSITSNLKFCKIFWSNFIILPGEPFDVSSEAVYCYGIGRGLHNYRVKVENFFPWYIRNHPCIPTTIGQILEPAKVFFNSKEIVQEVGDYLPVFDGPILPTAWQRFLKLKPKVELEDCLKVLELVAAEIGEKEVTKAVLKQVGLIFNRLSKLIPELDEAKKVLIQQWGELNKLPSRDRRFELITDLKLIRISGFNSEPEQLKLIHIPDNCDKDTEQFQELIQLFGVKAISEMEHTKSGERLDLTLKNKFVAILPYLATIVAKRTYSEARDEFNKLYNILDLTTFYSVNEIRVELKYEDKVIKGPLLQVHHEPTEDMEHNIFFKGSWASTLIKYQLFNELSKLLNIPTFISDLGQLLEVSESELDEWLENNGLQASDLPNRRNFKAPKVELFDKETKGYNGGALINGIASPVGGTQVNGIMVNSVTNISDVQVTKQEAPFVPTILPSQIDYSKVRIVMKTTFGSSSTEAVVKSFASMRDDADKKKVGDWAEDFVNRILLRLENGITKVVWENKNGESYKPYDFIVTQNGVERFIDVKGTPSMEKNIVILSEAEWKFMLERGPNYSIYRVFGAGVESAGIEITDDPADKLKTGALFPNPITLQL